MHAHAHDGPSRRAGYGHATRAGRHEPRHIHNFMRIQLIAGRVQIQA
jgi:hypothetical protein